MPHAEYWQACYRPDLCYSFLRMLKMTTATDVMEGGDGMVAVVHGLRDTGLCVTLLEGTRRYTLMPNSVPHPRMPSCIHVTRDVLGSTPVSTEMCTEPGERCDSSVQATDGRYTSIYKIKHCKVRRTSPPVDLTEIPPQRAEWVPGNGNVEVAGISGGEKYSPVGPTNKFGAGMSWPDRGSVYAPRPSYETNPSANTLGKYPDMSPQRSSEVVERLVNYAHPKLGRSSKNNARNRMSPTLLECNSSHNLQIESKALPTRSTCCEPAVNIRPQTKTDESPTKEGRSKKCELCPELKSATHCRNFEIRCLRDIPAKTRDGLKNLITQNATPVNMGIQAVIELISREVATMPRVEPPKRNVAVPLSPISSATQRCKRAPIAAFKSVQTLPANISSKTTRKFVQATSSSIELLNTLDRWQNNKHSGRKSRSEEEFRSRKEDFRKKILHLLERIDCQGDKVCQAFRDDLVKKIKKNRRKINLGIDERAKSAPFGFKAGCRHCANICRIKKEDLTRSIGISTADSLQNLVKDWLQEIYTNNSESLPRHSLDQMVTSLVAKLRIICLRPQDISKSEIMRMIEEVTFDASNGDRNVLLNNLAEALTNKIKDVLHSRSRKLNSCRLREGNSKNKNSKCFAFKKLIQPTEEELHSFVREELLGFMKKFHLKLNSRSIGDVETEVIDILIDSIDELQWGDNDKIKEEVAIALRDISKLPESYFNCLAEALVKRFKGFMRVFNASNEERVQQQTYVVLQNTIQNTSIQPNDVTGTSIGPVTESDVEAHIERYTSQLTQIIEAWWTSILGADENEKGFREVAINDLAGDIVDRHRFLERDPSKRWADAEEVEYLKFQIFRWINKLVGEEAMQQAIDRAPQLMEQIQRIPVPVMRSPEGVAWSQNIVHRPGTNAPVQGITPARTAPPKPSYNDNQFPTHGAIGRGGNISEGPRKLGATYRRGSEPGAYSLGPMSNAMNVKQNRIGGLPGPETIRRPQGRRYSLPANIGSPTANMNAPLPSIPQITKDFTDYLSNWVDQIPIPENNPQEQDIANKLRRDIYNGMLTAYVKAEMNPTNFRNEFYLQDFFDKELEEMLASFPSSSELTAKRQSLKTQLAKRAIDTIKAIREANASTSYRFRLWDSLTSTLPPRPVVDDRHKSAAHLFEEFLKLNIAEDYLLFRLHLDMNKAKQGAHRNKIYISIQKLHENAMLLPGSDRISPDGEDFRDKMIRCLVNVELPSRDAMQDEADQIVLAHEITQWMQDLPIAQSDAHLEQLQRRRHRDTLAKKIHEIEKQTNLCDNSSIRQMKNELSKFLEKFSPRPEEAGNLSFLIDEFINRLKNRREKVERPIDFPMFFKHVPFSSSFVDINGPIVITESLEEDRRHLGPPEAAGPHMLGADLAPQAPPYKEPTNAQWLTLLNTQERLQREREAQAPAAIPPQIPSCCQPATAMSLRPQAIGGNFGHSAQAPHKEPSNVEWRTLLNTQEQIDRENEALAAQRQAQQVPPCCQPPIAGSQGEYGGRDSGGVYAPIVAADARSLHASQVAGASYHTLASAGRQFAAPAAAPSLHSEMRRLVDLQDQRLSMMPNAMPSARPGPSGGTSFVQPPAQPVIQMPVIPPVRGILGTSQMAGPSGVVRPKSAGPNEPGIRSTPVAQHSVRSRQFESPQQIMRGGTLSHQSRIQSAAPLGEQEAVFATRHNLEEIPEQNLSRPIMSPLEFSMHAPVGFSTPRQSLVDRGGEPDVANVVNVPAAPRARRKRAREDEGVRPEAARRRLNLEDDVEEEEERERDEVQCRCTERLYRCRRRRPMCCDCEDMDYPRYFPMPYPYGFF